MNDMTNCKGCRIANLCKEMIVASKIKECPCRICLIKGMCQVSCEDFLRWQKYGLQYNEDILS